MSVRAGVAAVALCLLAAYASEASANCGAEGCPLAPPSSEVTRGRFAVDFGYQYVEANKQWNGNHAISEADALAEDGGFGHIVEQLTLTRSFLVNARARLTNRLVLTGSWPYIERVHQHALAHHAGYFIPATWHMQGPGDATVLANWTVLASPERALGALTLQAGAKLPTGQRNVELVEGEQPEPSARPGTGSTDLILGVQYLHLFTLHTFRGLETAVPLTANVGARVNGRGTDEYRMGNEWTANLGSSFALMRRVQVLGQLNFSAHARDEVGNTDAAPHSTGSTALFASPGLRAEFLPGAAVFGYYQLRVYEHTNGPQLVAPYHVSLGIQYALR